MKKVTLKNAATQGFSLVEMLVVIAVIGVIAAIAIPQIGGINAGANTAKNQRNAQSLVSVYAAATAAGASFTAQTEDGIVGDLTGATGVKVAGGAFDGKVFSVPGLSDTDKGEAKKFIKYDSTLATLVYVKDGDGS